MILNQASHIGLIVTVAFAFKGHRGFPIQKSKKPVPFPPDVYNRIRNTKKNSQPYNNPLSSQKCSEIYSRYAPHNYFCYARRLCFLLSRGPDLSVPHRGNVFKIHCTFRHIFLLSPLLMCERIVPMTSYVVQPLQSIQTVLRLSS